MHASIIFLWAQCLALAAVLLLAASTLAHDAPSAQSPESGALWRVGIVEPWPGGPCLQTVHAWLLDEQRQRAACAAERRQVSPEGRQVRPSSNRRPRG